MSAESAPVPDSIPNSSKRKASSAVKLGAALSCFFLLSALGYAGLAGGSLTEAAERHGRQSAERSAVSDAERHLEIASTLERKAARAREMQQELGLRADELKQRSDELFRQLKSGINAGVSRDVLKKAASEVRKMESEEAQLRREACQLAYQTSLFAAQARSEAVQGHQLNMDAAVDEDERAYRRFLLEQAEAALAELPKSKEAACPEVSS